MKHAIITAALVATLALTSCAEAQGSDPGLPQGPDVGGGVIGGGDGVGGIESGPDLGGTIPQSGASYGPDWGGQIPLTIQGLDGALDLAMIGIVDGVYSVRIVRLVPGDTWESVIAGHGLACYVFPGLGGATSLLVVPVDTNGYGDTIAEALADYHAKMAELASAGAMPCVGLTDD